MWRPGPLLYRHGRAHPHAYQDKLAVGEGLGGTGRCSTVMARLVRVIATHTCHHRWPGRVPQAPTCTASCFHVRVDAGPISATEAARIDRSAFTGSSGVIRI